MVYISLRAKHSPPPQKTKMQILSKPAQHYLSGVKHYALMLAYPLVCFDYLNEVEKSMKTNLRKQYISNLSVKNELE